MIPPRHATSVTAMHFTERLAAADWQRLTQDLDERGIAVLPGLLHPADCRLIADSHADDSRFRSTVTMERHGFGRGEYRYFAYPLPFDLEFLRAMLYEALAPLANQWNQRLGIVMRFPATHRDFLARCNSAGQERPTPLLLKYRAGDYNCLHRDLYGEHVFPLQLTVLLSSPGEDFTGGEFVVTEQRPRMQSRVEVVPLRQGDAVLFAVNERPVRGARRAYRVTHRHGVSRVVSGARQALGVILHDAK
jgi:uncharacterized protein